MMKSKQIVGLHKKPVELMSAKDFKKSVSSEKNVYKQISQWLKMAYPELIYRWDYGAGVYLTKSQAGFQKGLQMEKKGYPDLWIAEPRTGCYGFYLEIKKEGEVLCKRDGSAKTPHIAEQTEMLARLSAKGYKTMWAFGFEDAKKKIEDYLGPNVTPFNE